MNRIKIKLIGKRCFNGISFNEDVNRNISEKNGKLVSLFKNDNGKNICIAVIDEPQPNWVKELEGFRGIAVSEERIYSIA